MTHIYDLLLNWTDTNKVYEFYEWDLNDDLEHIKKIPLFKVTKEDYNNIFNSDIVIDESFLELIKNHTEIYTNKKPLKIIYATLLTDGIRTFAIEFNDKGESIYKSKLLLDEEEETLDMSYKLQISKIKYKITKNKKDNPFETRLEYKIEQFLQKELDDCYIKSQKEKLKYLYMEYFNDVKDNIDDIYKDLKNSLKDGINLKHNKIYELLKLSYTKKPVK